MVVREWLQMKDHNFYGDRIFKLGIRKDESMDGLGSCCEIQRYLSAINELRSKFNGCSFNCFGLRNATYRAPLVYMSSVLIPCVSYVYWTVHHCNS